MKQIKTVIYPIENAMQYDEEINNLLADGWEIKKRAHVNARGQLSEAFEYSTIQLLYAELERTVPYFEEVTL